MNTIEKLALTGHELLFLLGMDGSPSSKRSRELLELVDIEDSDDYELFGMTTLLARDLATIEASGAVPSAQAMHIAVALLEAREWVRIAVTSDESTIGYIIVRSEEAAIAMQVRELGIYDILPIAPDTDLKELSIDIVRGAISNMNDGLFCGAQFVTLDGPEHAVNLAVVGGEARVNTVTKGQDQQPENGAIDLSLDKALDVWVAQVQAV